MSAELVLLAAPNDPAWLARYRALTFTDWAVTNQERQELLMMLDGLPWCFIGEVSWGKAALFGDVDRYVPGPVAAVSEYVGDGLVLTSGRAKAVTVAMSAPNLSIYGQPYTVYTCRTRGARPVKVYPGRNTGMSGVAPRRHVKRWLAEHVGCYLLQDTW